MRNVLMVAYMFPPIGGIGVQRTVQFVKYLPRSGWRPVVLTVKEGRDFIMDAELSAQLPDEVHVHRSRSWEPLNAARVKQIATRVETGSRPSWGRQRLLGGLKATYAALHVPDDKIGWWPHAVKLGKQLITETQIDLIYATAPPYTNFLVGSTLGRDMNIPLVLDYRDEWSTIEYRALRKNRATQAANRHLEMRVLRTADRIVSALLPLERRLRDADLLPSSTPVDYIPNGFDPADVEGVAYATLRDHDKFTIVYTGTFYGERRTPEYFLRGLNAFLSRRPEVRSQVTFRIVGSIFERHRSIIDELKLADVVKLDGVVSHQDAVRHQLAADLLLLVVGKGPGSEMVLTGKIFEYINVRRPIFGLVPLDGPAARLIRETRTGDVIEPDDVPGIAQKLAELYDAWSSDNIPFAPNEEKVRQFDRRPLTEQLARTFDTVVAAAG